MGKKRILALLMMLIVFSIFFLGCTEKQQQTNINDQATEPQKVETKPTEIANPASVYCKEQGYQSEKGVCIFPDSSECKEWDFFRGKCGQKFTYCEQHNGEIENRIKDMGGWVSEYAICIFPDNSECEEGKYFKGECKPGETK